MTADDLERRLRDALAARAGQVTPNDLRPPVPPTMAAERRTFPLLLRAVLLASALMLVAVALIPLLRPDPAPQQPASPPSTVTVTVCPPYVVEEDETPSASPCPVSVYSPSSPGGG
ncbi:hypothetical protein ACIA8K_37610 [Catenuloplanes sp. NPDC051500]|uniref:hypothetical protein n=1 Tax=Catenuloplanes sp. NPDC051500 TaxID=3363959 RepID=UPI00378EBA10